MPEIRLEHVTKHWGKFYAVDDLNLVIENNAFMTLLGPSGCGKTTTLRMIAGFESPDEGEIYLGDEAIKALTPNKRDTAMVFQSYALLPHYNVFDNVAYGLKLRKIPKDEIRERVMKILDLVELTGMETEQARTYLKSIHGVGNKVADCVLLFGLHRVEAFPVDTWIRQVIDEHYGGKFPVEHYDGHAGIIQQFIFYYMQQHKGGKTT